MKLHQPPKFQERVCYGILVLGKISKSQADQMGKGKIADKLIIYFKSLVLF